MSSQVRPPARPRSMQSRSLTLEKCCVHSRSLMTRSSSILNLAAMGAEETIILCPANHSPPIRVAPYPGAPGYEAVMTCLATPEVRARTVGMVATIPKMA